MSVIDLTHASDYIHFMPTPAKTHAVPHKRILSLKEAADYLGIGVTKFNQLRRAGQLAGKRHGRLVFFSRDELDRYWDSLPADEPGISA